MRWGERGEREGNMGRINGKKGGERMRNIRDKTKVWNEC